MGLRKLKRDSQSTPATESQQGVTSSDSNAVTATSTSAPSQTAASSTQNDAAVSTVTTVVTQGQSQSTSLSLSTATPTTTVQTTFDVHSMNDPSPTTGTIQAAVPINGLQTIGGITYSPIVSTVAQATEMPVTQYISSTVPLPDTTFITAFPTVVQTQLGNGVQVTLLSPLSSSTTTSSSTTPTPTTSQASASTSSASSAPATHGLSGGQIAGIVVGVAAALCLAFGSLIFFIIKSNDNKREREKDALSFGPGPYVTPFTHEYNFLDDIGYSYPDRTISPSAYIPNEDSSVASELEDPTRPLRSRPDSSPVTLHHK